MPLYLAVIWATIAAALLGAIYVGLGGRALFGTHERPDRILSRRVRLDSLESGPLGFDPNQPKLPAALVEQFTSNGEYMLRFEQPVAWLGKVETHAFVRNHHVGYPVSLVARWRRRGVFVGGRFGSGEQ